MGWVSERELGWTLRGLNRESQSLRLGPFPLKGRETHKIMTVPLFHDPSKWAHLRRRNDLVS